MSRFVRGRSITRGGHTWYCQTPGSSWMTDPEFGWWLYYTDGPSWWLIGPDYSETDMGTTKLKAAMDEAVQFIEKKRKGD